MGCAATVRASILLISALSASTANADGECARGFRDTTAAERQTMLAVMEAAKAALPLAPTGWAIGGYEQPSPVGRVCIDGESTPWHYAFSRTISRADDAAQREQALADSREQVRATQTARQPQLDALMAKLTKLGTDLAAAGQSGDQTRIDAVGKEMELAQQELERVMSQGDDATVATDLAAATLRDRTMSIAVAVNPGTVAEPAMQPVAPFGGAQTAYRWTTSSDGIETAHAVLLFGAWQPRPEGGMSSGRRGPVSPAAAHALAVTVEADPGRIDWLLGSIDFAALAATLGR